MASRGKITPELLSNNENKFWERVQKTNDRCWIWEKALDRDGYGVFEFYIGNGVPYIIRAHRASYFFRTGVLLPSNILVCHHCDNPSCVNPDHLFSGTIQDNTKDMNSKDRGRSRLTKKQVIQIRKLLQKDVKLTFKQLGKQFQVGSRVISQIARYENWPSLDIGPIPKRSKIDDQDRIRIKELSSSGVSARKIGLTFGICHHTVLVVVRN